MARGAPEIAQRQAVAAQVRHRVGDYELSEPDYQQVLLWAERFKNDAGAVLTLLALGFWKAIHWADGQELKLEIQDSRIKRLV